MCDRPRTASSGHSGYASVRTPSRVGTASSAGRSYTGSELAALVQQGQKLSFEQARELAALQIEVLRLGRLIETYEQERGNFDEMTARSQKEVETLRAAQETKERALRETTTQRDAATEELERAQAAEKDRRRALEALAAEVFGVDADEGDVVALIRRQMTEEIGPRVEQVMQENEDLKASSEEIMKRYEKLRDKEAQRELAKRQAADAEFWEPFVLLGEGGQVAGVSDEGDDDDDDDATRQLLEEALATVREAEESETVRFGGSSAAEEKERRETEEEERRESARETTELRERLASQMRQQAAKDTELDQLRQELAEAKQRHQAALKAALAGQEAEQQQQQEASGDASMADVEEADTIDKEAFTKKLDELGPQMGLDLSNPGQKAAHDAFMSSFSENVTAAEALLGELAESEKEKQEETMGHLLVAYAANQDARDQETEKQAQKSFDLADESDALLAEGRETTEGGGSTEDDAASVNQAASAARRAADASDIDELLRQSMAFLLGVGGELQLDDDIAAVGGLDELSQSAEEDQGQVRQEELDAANKRISAANKRIRELEAELEKAKSANVTEEQQQKQQKVQEVLDQAKGQVRTKEDRLRAEREKRLRLAQEKIAIEAAEQAEAEKKVVDAREARKQRREKRFASRRAEEQRTALAADANKTFQNMQRAYLTQLRGMTTKHNATDKGSAAARAKEAIQKAKTKARAAVLNSPPTDAGDVENRTANLRAEMDAALRQWGVETSTVKGGVTNSSSLTSSVDTAIAQAAKTTGFSSVGRGSADHTRVGESKTQGERRHMATQMNRAAGVGRR